MSNYMTMALDPNTKGHLEYMQQWDPTFPELMKSLQFELDKILAEKYNNSLLNLFEKVAIRFFYYSIYLYLIFSYYAQQILINVLV